MLTDIAQQSGSFCAVKKPIPVAVEFAEKNGVLQTLEGLVQYQSGDVLLTGIERERWPVPRVKFDATYEPVESAEGGAKKYVKRPVEVIAWVTPEAMDVPLSGERGTLHAEPGDVLVQYAPGDVYVVAARIFEASYTRL